MEEDRPSQSGNSRDKEVIEIEPPETVQDPIQELQAEGDILWAALQRRFGTTEWIAICAIVVLALITILFAVLLALVLTGNICA